MIKKIANWYADVGKKILLYILLVCFILGTIGCPILCFVFCAEFFKYGEPGLGVLLIFVGLVSIFVCLFIVGCINGEIILFNRINTKKVVTINKVVEKDNNPKQEQVSELKQETISAPKQEQVIKTAPIQVSKDIKAGVEIYLAHDTKVSPFDPTVIPTNTKCIVRDITPNGIEVSVSFSGRFFVLNLQSDDIKLQN